MSTFKFANSFFVSVFALAGGNAAHAGDTRDPIVESSDSKVEIQRSTRGSVLVQGHVLKRSDHEVLVDVGNDDKARVGDELVAYRVTLFGIPRSEIQPYYHVKRTGAARITQLIGPHAARAQLVSGVVVTGEFVEFRGERKD